MAVMNVHERQIKILEENLARPLGEWFDTVTPPDYSRICRYYEWREREDAEENSRNDHRSVFSCYPPMLAGFPRTGTSYEVINDSSIESRSSTEAARQLELRYRNICAVYRFVEGTRMNRRDGLTTGERGSIYGMGKNGEEK